MADIVHVVGAGLAGLAAAVRLAQAGRRVHLHEAARQAGGRCRSYADATLGLTIDNGNHLLLSGNRAALAYCRDIGAGDALHGPEEASFPFIDLKTGARWTLRPNAGRVPWWVFSPGRRVPGSRARDYLAPAALLASPRDRPIGEAMTCSGPLYDRLWGPILLAGLNTPPAGGSTRLAAALMRETLLAGGAACRPLVATGGLSAAFVDPALRLLAAHDGEVRLGRRLRQLRMSGDVVEALVFSGETVELGRSDAVVLAVPSGVAVELVPGLIAPTEFHAIVNAHFKVTPPAGTPLFTGVVNATTEWVFSFEDRLSVTVSGADRLLDVARDALAQAIWAEVAAVVGLDSALPAWQIVAEKRATFAATPEQNARRPGATTRWRNLMLAGDWTQTGLPATIEGAIRSGDRAAALALAAKPTSRAATGTRIPTP